MHPLEQVRPAPAGPAGPAATLSGSVIPGVTLVTHYWPHPFTGSPHSPHAREAFPHDKPYRHQHRPSRQEVVAPQLFGDRWRKSRPNATRPGQQPTANEFDDTGGSQPGARPGSGSSRLVTSNTTGSTATTILGSAAATSGSSVSGPGPGGGGPSSTGGSSSSVKCTVVNRLHSITAVGGSGASRAADQEGPAGSTGSSSKKRQQQRSRITYDREQGVRFYRGTETTDSNDCDCEDI
uniref:Uncharacterized protein n=1 Tax=Anopheles melas TaxID=34690 RepID=A0A182UE78_9DIPT